MPSRKRKISDEENQQAVFVDSTHPEKLQVNSFLHPPEIIKTASIKSGKIFSVKFALDSGKELSNIYLIVNGVKKDMLNQVPSGKYSFTFRAQEDENLLELFCTSGNRRSKIISTYLKASN